MLPDVQGLAPTPYRLKVLYIDGQRLDTRLKWTIAWRVAEHMHQLGRPLLYRHLARWIRAQWPQILPDAIGKALCDLAQIGFLEVDDRGWSVRPPESRTRAAREHRNGWNPQQWRAA